MNKTTIRTLVPITEDFIFCEEQHLYTREFYVHILLSCILNITANKISKCIVKKDRQIGVNDLGMTMPSELSTIS